MDVLVCVKRVPDVAGEVTLRDDAQGIDARHVGFTLSPHEECAVELATQLADGSGGAVTVLTVGSADAVEQLRTALAVGCADAVLVQADPAAYGPADVAAAIAAVVRAREDAGRRYDLVLLGNDAADTGDFQVPVRLGYALGRPVVTGVSTVATSGAQQAVARRTGAAGSEVFQLPLPAVIAVMEGGVAPRYPSVPGRMRARKAPVETIVPEFAPRGSGRVRLTLPPTRPSSVEILGRGPDAAPAVVDLLVSLGVVPT